MLTEPAMVAGLTHSRTALHFDGFAPDPAVLRVRQLLEEGGVLVCANLQLASGSVVRVLLRNLDDQKKWQREPSIEGGATQVFIKRWA